MIRFYLRKLRDADARWHAINADNEDADATSLPPSLTIALAILLVGSATCFIGGMVAGWW